MDGPGPVPDPDPGPSPLPGPCPEYPRRSGGAHPWGPVEPPAAADPRQGGHDGFHGQGDGRHEIYGGGAGGGDVKPQQKTTAEIMPGCWGDRLMLAGFNTSWI